MMYVSDISRFFTGMAGMQVGSGLRVMLIVTTADQWFITGLV